MIIDQEDNPEIFQVFSKKLFLKLEEVDPEILGHLFTIEANAEANAVKMYENNKNMGSKKQASEYLKLLELTKIQDEYIKLLGEEIDGMVGLHMSHGGWNSPRVEEGSRLRAKIKELKGENKTD